MIYRRFQLFFLLIFFGACSTVAPVEKVNDNANNIDSVDNFTFLALGDSYTIGQSVPFNDRWPNQLKDQLNQDSMYFDSVHFVAKTGWTTTNLIQAIEDEDIKEPYELVSLSIGVNNQYQGLPFSIFEKELDSLLMIAVTIAAGHDKLIVVSIPDYGSTPFGGSNAKQIGFEIDQYNSHLKTKCSELEISYIDITEISRMVGNDGLTFDDLHPNGYQYSLWVEEILPIAQKILFE